jgi:hypothetical protein
VYIEYNFLAEQCTNRSVRDVKVFAALPDDSEVLVANFGNLTNRLAARTDDRHAGVQLHTSKRHDHTFLPLRLATLGVSRVADLAKFRRRVGIQAAKAMK